MVACCFVVYCCECFLLDALASVCFGFLCLSVAVLLLVVVFLDLLMLLLILLMLLSVVSCCCCCSCRW